VSDETNVLVVDDIEQNLAAIEALLAHPGLRVLKAGSGTDALEMLLAHEVALALVDVQMPNMNGFELAELIRGSERTRSVPLIFLTAGAHEQAMSFRGYEAGAVDFLYKPLDAHVLRGKVEVFVALHTQKKQMARQLEELRQALNLNELFTAVLGHDLRNPLSAVMNGAGILLRGSQDERVIGTARRIQASTRRMARMVDQLLDVARIRTDGLALQMQDTDYASLCRGIVDELNEAYPEARVSLSVSDDVRGQADADRLSQVVSNLVGNAVQHGEPDHPVQLQVDGSQRERIRLCVRNRGAIPPEQLPHLFDAFHPGLASRRPGQGLGLGLYIVKKFVDAHGGSVQVRSHPATGTEFELELPRRGPAGEAGRCAG